MKFSAKTVVRVALVSALAASLAVPATAGAVSKPAVKHALRAAAPSARAASIVSDDNIPGIPVTSSPITGELSYVSDLDFDGVDVYSLDLVAGQAFTARVSAANTALDFDLELYAPGSTTIDYFSSSFVEPVAGTWTSKNPDVLTSYASMYEDTYVAPVSGTYYLVVWDMSFDYFPSTGYTVDFATGVNPTATIKTSATTVAYGQPATISGSIVGTDSVDTAGLPVELWGSPDPTSYEYLRVATSVTTTGGAYSFAARPSSRTTYIVRSSAAPAGYSFAQTGRVTVKPKTYLTTPSAPSTVYHNKAFTAFGYLKPKHTKGAKTVKIAAYRYESGKWVLRKTVYATNYDYTLNGSTYTKYIASVSLPYAGKWKLLSSTADDGAHAYTLSGTRYVTAK